MATELHPESTPSITSSVDTALGDKVFALQRGSGNGLGGTSAKSRSKGSPCKYALGASAANILHRFDAEIEHNKFNASKEAVGESLRKPPISL